MKQFTIVTSRTSISAKQFNCGMYNRYVITLGLHSKYDVDVYYFIFAVRILANPWDYIL